MSRVLKYLLLTLALLAVGGAQIAGLSRGYLCECTGQVIVTDSPTCADSELTGGQTHQTGDTHQNGGHPHESFVESLKSVSFTPLILTLPPSVEMDWPETVIMGLLQARETAGQLAELKPPPPDETGGNVPASLLVARTIVRLV